MSESSVGGHASWLIGLSLSTLLAGCMAPYSELSSSEVTLVLRGEIPLVEVAPGTPAEQGERLGRALAQPIGDLRSSVLEVGGFDRVRASALLPYVPEAYRVELEGIARGAEVPFEDLLVANVTADAMCTAVAAWGPATGDQPLLLARNMDFPPADELGPYTSVRVYPAQGARAAFVSIGWPGFNGVVSGFNQAGVCAVVLLNFGANQEVLGTPLAYRVREVLEGAGTFAEAEAILTASPVASDHYVLLADLERAAVFHQRARRGEAPAFVRLDGDEGLLLGSNGASDPLSGLICDARTRCLADLCATPPLDAAALRSALGAAYLNRINCQSMLFRPATATLQLALGDSGSPASRSAWVEVDLAPCLAGGGVEAATVKPLEPCEAREHYTEGDYGGEGLTARLAEAYRPQLDAAMAIEDRRDRILRVSEFAETLWAKALDRAPYRDGDPAYALLAEAAASNRADLSHYVAALEAKPDPGEFERLQRIFLVESMSNPTPSYAEWLQEQAAAVQALGDR